MDLSLSPSLPIAAPGLWTLRSSHAVRNRKQTEREREARDGGREGGHYPGIKWDHRRRRRGLSVSEPMGFVSFARELTPPHTAQVSE